MITNSNEIVLKHLIKQFGVMRVLEAVVTESLAVSAEGGSEIDRANTLVFVSEMIDDTRRRIMSEKLYLDSLTHMLEYAMKKTQQALEVSA